MSNILVNIQRDSVCMGDDIDAPHAKCFEMSRDDTLLELFSILSKRNYLAKVADNNHSWSFFIEGHKLATVNGNNREPDQSEYINHSLSDFEKNGVVNAIFKYNSSAK